MLRAGFTTRLIIWLSAKYKLKLTRKHSNRKPWPNIVTIAHNYTPGNLIG